MTKKPLVQFRPPESYSVGQVRIFSLPVSDVEERMSDGSTKVDACRAVYYKTLLFGVTFYKKINKASICPIA